MHTGFACGNPVSGEAGDPVALWLETSLPGVFAIGDVRAGSVKRVSAAVGEGAGVVAQLHQRLQALRAQPGGAQQSPPAPESPSALSEPETPHPTPVSAGA